MRPLSGKTAVALFVLAVLPGCTSTLAGHETKVPDPPAGPDGVIVALLNSGNYPTKPAAPLGNAGKLGPVVEAQRMADYVVIPTEVDATISDQSDNEIGQSAMVLGSSKNIALYISSKAGDVPGDIAAAHHFVDGFATSRRSSVTGHGKAMSNIVLRFPDPASAADAAKQMAAMPAPADAPRTPVGVPRHPEALASTFDTRDATNSHVVESYTAHGNYVLYQYSNAEENLDVAAQLVATTLDLQAARIDAFVPTDPARLADLPRDPDGLFAATLRLAPDDESINVGVYSARGALHFEPDALGAQTMFNATGVDQVVISKAVVYRAKDPANAQRVVDYWATDKAAKPAAGIAGFPSAKCFDLGKSDVPGRAQFACVATAGRYAFRVFSHQDDDVRQQAAAQYLMLMAKG